MLNYVYSVQASTYNTPAAPFWLKP